MKIKRFAMAASILAMAISSAAMGADEAHKIKIHRPEKAGSTYDVHIVASMERMLLVVEGGQEQENGKQNSSIDLTGREKVSDVDDDGKERIVVVKVQKCVDAKGKELLPAGSELTVDIGEDEVSFSLKDGEVSKEARQALSVIYSPRVKKKVTDDDVFGTAEAKKVGESWDINTKAMLEDMGMKVDPKNASGKMTLEKAEKSNGIPCLLVSGKVKVTDLPTEGMPAGFKTKTGTMDISVSGLLPEDEKMQPLEEHHEMAFKQVAAREAADGEKAAEVTVTLNASKTKTSTPVK